MSVNGSTRAVRLSERRNFRRSECNSNSPKLPLTFITTIAAGAGTSGGMLQVRVHVPGHALSGYLGMFAKKIERIRGSLGIDPLGGIQSGLRGGLGLHGLATIQDGEIIVGCEIVRIDGLQGLKLGHGVIGVMLLVIGDAQFAPRIARLRILFDNSL